MLVPFHREESSRRSRSFLRFAQSRGPFELRCLPLTTYERERIGRRSKRALVLNVQLRNLGLGFRLRLHSGLDGRRFLRHREGSGGFDRCGKSSSFVGLRLECTSRSIGLNLRLRSGLDYRRLFRRSEDGGGFFDRFLPEAGFSEMLPKAPPSIMAGAEAASSKS